MVMHPIAYDFVLVGFAFTLFLFPAHAALPLERRPNAKTVRYDM